MENEYAVTITGFKTKQQAKAFYSWYEGQGEQDACNWFASMKDDGELDVDSMLTDMDHGSKWQDNTLVFKIEPNGEDE